MDDILNNNYEPLTLPSDYVAMQSFIQHNKIKLMEHTISAIEYALRNDYDIVTVFKFDETDYIINLMKPNFKANIDDILSYYIATEHFELCTRIKSLLNQFPITVN